MTAYAYMHVKENVGFTTPTFYNRIEWYTGNSNPTGRVEGEIDTTEIYGTSTPIDSSSFSHTDVLTNISDSKVYGDFILELYSTGMEVTLTPSASITLEVGYTKQNKNYNNNVNTTSNPTSVV
jgi:hypothetical protein